MLRPLIPSSGLDAGSAVRLLVAIVAVGVVLRLGSAVYQGGTIEEMPGVADQVSYHELAGRVLGGHGFSFGADWWPATKADAPTAHWSYLYVLFLAAVYGVLGADPLSARLVQAILAGVLHPLLAWRIGRRLFGAEAGLAAAAATAVYGYFVFYAGSLVTESLYMLALLWVMDVATSMGGAPRGEWPPARRWALLGLACATATLLRQAFLLMVPLVLGWIAWRLWTARAAGTAPGRDALVLARRMALALVVVAACIVPWTARNYRAFGELVPLNTNAGFVFYWGNHPVHGTEFRPIMSTGTTNYMTLVPKELFRLNEAQLDRVLLAQGLQFVRDDPSRYLQLSVSRAKEYFRFWPAPDSSRSGNLVRLFSFGVALPFIVLGVALALGRGRRADDAPGAGLLLMVAGAYTLVHLLTWTLIRYRLPVDALMMPFVGLSVAVLAERIGRRAAAGDAPLADVQTRPRTFPD